MDVTVDFKEGVQRQHSLLLRFFCHLLGLLSLAIYDGYLDLFESLTSR